MQEKLPKIRNWFNLFSFKLLLLYVRACLCNSLCVFWSLSMNIQNGLYFVHANHSTHSFDEIFYVGQMWFVGSFSSDIDVSFMFLMNFQFKIESTQIIENKGRFIKNVSNWKCWPFEKLSIEQKMIDSFSFESHRKMMPPIICVLHGPL